MEINILIKSKAVILLFMTCSYFNSYSQTTKSISENVVKLDTIISNDTVVKYLKINTTVWKNTIHNKGFWSYSYKDQKLTMNIVFSEKAKMTADEKKRCHCMKKDEKNESLEDYIKRIYNRSMDKLLTNSKDDTTSTSGNILYSFNERLIKLTVIEPTEKGTKFIVSANFINEDGISFSVTFLGSEQLNENVLELVDKEILNLIESLSLYNDSFKIDKKVKLK